MYSKVIPIITPEVAAFIRARRKKLKMNQVDLAAALGVSQSAISKLESCELPLTGVSLERFMKALKISARKFLTGIPVVEPVQAEITEELASCQPADSIA